MRFNYHLLTAMSVAMAPAFLANAQTQITADQMPQQWQYTERFDQMSASAEDWWSGFGDKMLDSLIDIGIHNNYNVLTAQRRIEMARQSLRQTRSQYYPTIGVNAGWTRTRTSGMTTATPMDATTLSYFDLGATMSWQIDIFGKITERARQDKAAFRATSAEYDGMMLTVAANIATAYMQLRMDQARLQVLNEHVEKQKHVADITKARHEAGLASMLDVTQALTTYYSTLASVTAINTSIATSINSLAILIGVYPQELTPYLMEAAPMPDYRQIVAVGIPMDLLRRRPDIAEAEYTLAGYAAALGVAKKDFLPTLTLNGSIGTSAHKAGDLFSDRSFTYSVAPTLSWTLFDGMGRNAAVMSAKEQMMTGIDNYNNTVLTAVQEVNNAMVTYYNDLEYIDYVTQAMEQAQKSYELSVDLYKQGLTDFINVSNSQISYLQYSSEYVAAKGQALVALVSLYQALGGGWQQ